ncbi:MAG: AEC family transporter [Clostridia bacterium]|nr:AEC family transporter [Clostridia bacterium]
MTIFISTMNQIVFLFGFIAIGYGLMKARVLPDNTSAVLSKLENVLFIPALVLGTFIENFTMDKIRTAWKLLLISSVIGLIAIPVAILVSRLVTKDRYTRNIYTYGLSFSNFGFMGNAVVSSLFPDMFFDYLIFTLPLWVLIYLWGVPRLLIADAGKKQTVKESLKSFVNPMFIAMLVGMVIGLLGIGMPMWLTNLISVSGSCMSPVAMLLTGVVVSKISLGKAFTNLRVYAISIVRLLIMPGVFIFAASFLNLSETVFYCALCSLAMPLGLNTIVIPSALGKDTSEAAGMAMISHLLAVGTIPLLFMIVG